MEKKLVVKIVKIEGKCPVYEVGQKIIKKYGIGRLLNLKDLEIEKNELIQLINNVERERIARIGKELFSIDSYKSRIISYWTQVLT